MKVALVTIEYPPETGGVARYLSELVRASRAELDVVRVTHSRRPLAWIGLLPRVRALAKTHRAIFVSHVLPIGTLAWMAWMMGGAPYHVLLHGLDIRLTTRSRWKRWLTKKILSNAKTVFVNSRYTERLVRETYPMISCVVVTPGVEAVDLPSREEARTRLGVSLDERVILSIGRLVKRKGHDLLIEAFARVTTPARVVVIGQGAEEATLKEQAKPFGERVSISTNATDEERWDWLVASDVFALTLRNDGDDPEGFGIVFLEAGLAGLPVVAGRNGGATEAVVDGVTGRLIDSEKPSEVARVIDELLTNHDLASQMGEAGRVRALKDFSWEERWLTVASHL